MTRAPENLLGVRKLLLTHLDVHPGQTVNDDLEPAEVGIVGDARHVGEGDSYHLGEPEQDPHGSYSVMESLRDRALTEYACAVDVGSFEVTTPKGTFDLPHYSRWLVAQCAANTADTRDIREVIYSPDGKVVKRWDRLGRRTSGDDTHLWHTHKSYFRDAIKAGRDQTAVVRRYLTTIGLIDQEDTMSADDATVGFVRALNYARNPDNPAWTDQQAQYGRQVRGALVDILDDVVKAEATSPEELGAALAGLPKPMDVDQLATALTERVMASLPAGTPMTDEQLERVLRNLLGSLNDAPQAG